MNNFRSTLSVVVLLVAGQHVAGMVLPPTFAPTSAPSPEMNDCWEWVVGYSRGSCEETCAEVGRTCAVEKLSEINSLATLESALSSAFLLGSTTGPGSVATFCDGGVNIWPFATAPAAFAYQTFVPNGNDTSQGVFKVSHYCYFPQTPAELQGNCTTKYVIPPAQRICSCWKGDCGIPSEAPTYNPTIQQSAAPTAVPTTAVVVTAAPSLPLNVTELTDCYEWVVGYSRGSCDETCADVGRSCAEGHLAQIDSVQALEAALSTSFLLGSSVGPGSVATFCDGGVNVWPFATAPAAFAYQTFVPNPANPALGVYKVSHYCYFPTNPAQLQGNCSTSFTIPPSQRICSCWRGDCDLPSAPPTVAPSVEVTVVPTVEATVPGDCLEWVLGYSKESCSLTCSRVSRVCREDQLSTIVTQQAFYDMVASATDLESNAAAGSATAFCNMGTNVYTFAPVPAAYTYVLCTSSGDVEQTYCNYPTSTADLGGDCDTAYVYPPAQRFCPCTLGDCPIEPVCNEWVLGYSSESCTLTCGRVSGTCNAAGLESIVTQQAFYDMVAIATPIDASCPTGGDAGGFCTQGINTYQFAAAPAAFSYLTHNVNGAATETYCNYPTSLASLNADCDAAYVYPPSRRFCSCTVTNCAPPAPLPPAPAPPVPEPPTPEPPVLLTAEPSVDPSAVPTEVPTADPTTDPTTTPTFDPTTTPTTDPSAVPTESPSDAPTEQPTVAPTADPSAVPTANPTTNPTTTPTAIATADPTTTPTTSPTFAQTAAPSGAPTFKPTSIPTIAPSKAPISTPTRAPTRAPSAKPTTKPTAVPTRRPTLNPTARPTAAPTGCYRWIVGYSEKSCTETCTDPEVGGNGVCMDSILKTVDTAQDFDTMLTSALLLGSGGTNPASVASFCDSGVNVFAFADAPGAFAYQSYVPYAPFYVYNKYCVYPTVGQVSTATCDTAFHYPPAQRMCSCLFPTCVDSEGIYGLPQFGRRLEEEGEEGVEGGSEVSGGESEGAVVSSAVSSVSSVDNAVEKSVVDASVLLATPAITTHYTTYMYCAVAALCALVLCSAAYIMYTASNAKYTVPSSPSHIRSTSYNIKKREVYIDVATDIANSAN